MFEDLRKKAEERLDLKGFGAAAPENMLMRSCISGIGYALLALAVAIKEKNEKKEE